MKEITPQRNASIPAEVVFTEIEQDQAAQGVLLHLETKRYYTLNESALCIWKSLCSGLSARASAEALAREFLIEPDEAETRVHSLLQRLRRARLIEVVDES